MRTFEEAVEIMVNWWVEKTFNTDNNQDNGDGLQSLIANKLANKLRPSGEDVDKQISAFSKSLKDYFLNLKPEERNYFNLTLSVDYDPNEPLHYACNAAGINRFVLPMKTFTRIELKDGHAVVGRFGYGSDFFKL